MPSALHGVSVLNTGDLSDQATRAWSAAGADQLETEDVSWRDYEVTQDLHGWTILPIARIVHQSDDGNSGEFDGWYLGEEYHGRPHPILLLPPEKVSRKTDPSARGAGPP